MTQKAPQNLWLMDVRVRERNLKSGALTDKDVEKYLTSLPDLEGDSESFATGQPALSASRDAVVTDDEGDDDESDDDDAPTDGAAG